MDLWCRCSLNAEHDEKEADTTALEGDDRQCTRGLCPGIMRVYDRHKEARQASPEMQAVARGEAFLAWKCSVCKRVNTLYDADKAGTEEPCDVHYGGKRCDGTLRVVALCEPKHAAGRPTRGGPPAPKADPPGPVPMRLPCPDCGGLHLDVGEFATKPHHTHACQHCGNVWRPAVVHTVGVQFLPGFRNEPTGD